MGAKPPFLFCAKKRITHIRYGKKRVFTRIQHTIFCSKSKSGQGKRGGKKQGMERGTREEAGGKNQIKREKNEKKGRNMT